MARGFWSTCIATAIICLAFAATSARGATTPWMLGEEHAPACYDLTNSDIVMPAGLDIQWVTRLPESLFSTAAIPAEFVVTIDHNVFWSDLNNQMRLGSSLNKWRGLCDPNVMAPNATASCSVSNTTSCCIWHANVHSCRQTTGSACEPWVTPLNATVPVGCGANAPNQTTVLVTHTSAQVGGIQAYTQNLQLPDGSWVVIAHAKIMNFQCAVGALRRSITPVIENADSNSEVVGLAVGISAGVVVMVVSLAAIKMMRASANVRDVSNAPRGGRGETTTILFTDIQDSTQLWGNYTMSAALALDIHHAAIRKAIVKHKGYEVKTVGDAFMIATKSPQAAIAIARDIQLNLNGAQWPRCITAHYQGEQLEDDPSQLLPPSPAASFNGLRVRIGIHTGTPDVLFDEVAKGYDYYGTDVNLTARAEATADGGQILLTPSTLAAVEKDLPDLRVAIGQTGRVSLKGFDEMLTLTSLELMDLAVPRDMPVHSKGDKHLAMDMETPLDPLNRSTESVKSAMPVDEMTIGEEAVAKRLQDQFSHCSLQQVLDVVAERRNTLETLLKPLKPKDQQAVVELLSKGWRTKVNAAQTRDQTLLGLVARLLPSEKLPSLQLHHAMNASSHGGSNHGGLPVPQLSSPTKGARSPTGRVLLA
jgi:class 3 adenylate cyclase